MMVLSLLGPLIASVLYVIVFQKAGFRGLILAICAAPLVSMVLHRLLVRFLIANGGAAYMGGDMAVVFILPALLSLAPLLVLAFMAWPPVDPSATRTSTENT